jgi:hypothetical protein
LLWLYTPLILDRLQRWKIKTLERELEERPLKPADGQKIVLKEVSYDRDLESSAQYKSKLVLSLINASQTTIHCLPADWVIRHDSVKLQMPLDAGIEHSRQERGVLIKTNPRSSNQRNRFKYG